MSNQSQDHQELLDPQIWVDRYGDLLYRYALLRLRDKTAAEDIVQETFLGALRNQNTYNRQSTIQNWLFGILKHKIIDHFRHLGREKPSEDPELDAQLQAPGFDDKGQWLQGPAPWHWNPSQALEEQEFRGVFENCLQALPQRTAEAFLLREMDGLKGEEICQVLKISPNNYWVMLYRARTQLRSCLETKWLGKVQG